MFLIKLNQTKLFNRGADQRRGQRKQAQLDCDVHGVWSSSLFWRAATGQGA